MRPLVADLSLWWELELVAGPDVKYEYEVLSLKMYTYSEVNIEMESQLVDESDEQNDKYKVDEELKQWSNQWNRINHKSEINVIIE